MRLDTSQSFFFAIDGIVTDGIANSLTVQNSVFSTGGVAVRLDGGAGHVLADNRVSIFDSNGFHFTNDASATVTDTQISAPGPNAGILIDNYTFGGGATLSITGSMITVNTFGASVGVGIRFDNVDGGTFTVADTMVLGNAGSTGIQVRNSDASITFNNTTIENVAIGIDLSTNTGTYTFQNGLSVTTMDGPGILSDTGGTLVITGATNSVTATGGPALDISSTTVDMTFASLSSTDSASQGIVFVGVTGTGATGGLLVTGTTTLIGPALASSRAKAPTISAPRPSTRA